MSTARPRGKRTKTRRGAAPLGGAALAALVLLGACGPLGKPAASADSLVARDIACSDGAELVTACTPTGIELCFNAIDDNCNGVIDEGCGVATGLLQFSIAWSEAGADVDLAVTDPAGATANAANKSSPSPTGFRIDRDCPGDGCAGQNEETVYFEGAEPPRGRYRVEVSLKDAKGESLPICVRLGARVGSRTFGANVTLSHKDDRKTLTFTL